MTNTQNDASDGKTQNSILPLVGLRVLDLGTFIAAPFCATTLSEFGADVVKVEAPKSGDPLRKFGTPSPHGDTLCWLSEARNKQSVTIDLRTEAGQNLLLALAEKADVLVENFRPGTLERWNIGPERLFEKNPNLIVLRISGFGQTGPNRDLTGFARIAHAFGGLAHLTGMPDGPPLTPGSTSLADYISGLFGTIGVMMALQVRHQVGGQVIDLALYESIFRMLDDLAPSYAQNGTVRGRLGVGTSNACPHGHFECKDGTWIAIACTSDKVFERFANAMNRPDLIASHPHAKDRIEDNVRIDQIVNNWCQTFSAPKAIEICNQYGVPCAKIFTIADIFQDPHFKQRNTIAKLNVDEKNEISVPNVIPKLSKTPGRIEKAGPPLGRDTFDLLRSWLGIKEEELTALRRSGVI